MKHAAADAMPTAGAPNYSNLRAFRHKNAKCLAFYYFAGVGSPVSTTQGQ